MRTRLRHLRPYLHALSAIAALTLTTAPAIAAASCRTFTRELGKIAIGEGTRLSVNAAGDSLRLEDAKGTRMIDLASGAVRKTAANGGGARGWKPLADPATWASLDGGGGAAKPGVPPLAEGSRGVALENGRLLLARDGGLRITASETFCSADRPERDSGCAPDAGAPIASEALRRLASAPRCHLPFDARLWSAYPPSDRPLADAEAVDWLMRFGKRGGFASERDGAVLERLLAAGIAKRYPGETRAAMLGVATYSPWLYATYVKDHPELGEIPVDSEPAPGHACAPKAERERMASGLNDWVSATFKASIHRDPFRAGEALAPIARLVLSHVEIDNLTDELATHLAEDAGKADPRREYFVPTAKTQALAAAALRARFGVGQAPIQDVRFVREADALRPVVLSTSRELAGAERTPYGFSFRTEAPMPLAPIGAGAAAERRDLEWIADGHRYRAHLEVEPVTAAAGPLADTRSSPDYRVLWRDGRLQGLMVMSSNMENEQAEETMGHYLSYYRGQGFRFGPERAIADTPAFLRERIAGREQAQYLIKEAHADEDEENVVETRKRSRVLRGERRVGDRVEVIELLAPMRGEGVNTSTPGLPRERLANDDFAALMRQRAQGGGKPLLYFNSSCWSARGKAIAEISETANPLLVDIPFRTEADEFRDKPTNIMRLMIDGMRKNRSYPELRRALKADREYADGSENQVIFPDESAYQELVLSKATPVKTRARIVEVTPAGEEKPYSPPYLYWAH